MCVWKSLPLCQNRFGKTNNQSSGNFFMFLFLFYVLKPSSSIICKTNVIHKQ